MRLARSFSFACVFLGLAYAAPGCGGDDSAGSGGGSTKSDGGTSDSGKGNGFGSGGGAEGGVTNAPCNPDPKNAEIPGNNCDDDGDGKVDNTTVCDSALAIDGDATALAHAIGLCDDATTKGFGLVSATFTRGYMRTDAPKDEQHGILGKFGDVIKPHEGSSLAVLSSGYGREFDGPSGTGNFNAGIDWWMYGTGNTGKPGTGAAPPTFPKKSIGCAQNSTVNDVIDLKLTLKAPPNAQGFAFDFDFWSGEWPSFVCSPYNDAFIAYLTSQALTDNISVDSKGNPISVNAGFLDRCTPNSPTGCTPSQGSVPGTGACASGTMELQGTGFYNLGTYCDQANQQTGGAATGWLSSTATVSPGETFTLELMIWDAGDGLLDSSVLVDNFRWTPSAPGTGTARGPK